MIKVSQSGSTSQSSSFASVEWDEFIPLVTFEKSSFTRPDDMRLVVDAKKVTLSGRIDEDKRKQDIHSFTILPGTYKFPFRVSEGCGTWDEDGIIEAKVQPSSTTGVKILSEGKAKRTHGDTFELEVEITGHLTRSFSINFYASDDTDDNNTGEYKDTHCGRIDIAVAGGSQVGFRLIDNIDALPKAPPGYVYPPYNTTSTKEITLSQKQANMYNDCVGVCYATSASRAQKAYIDMRGTGVVDLTVSNANLDHKIMCSYGGNLPFMGYGAGGAFARHGFGKTVDNAGAWSGKLQRGALLQNWHASFQGNVDEMMAARGHSMIFRNYLYNDAGEISEILYTDYHGDWSSFLRSSLETSETIWGVNLLDVPL